MNEDGNDMARANDNVFEALKEALSSARVQVRECLDSEEKLRDPDQIWRIYSNIEFFTGLLSFVKDEHRHLGTFKNVQSSKSNDPTSMPLERLLKLMRNIDEKLELAEKGLMERFDSQEGLNEARSARDSLKLLLLGYRKASSERKNSKSRT